MSTDWKSDIDIVDPGTVEHTAQLYPIAQWLNGAPKLASVGGVTHTGGVILPEKYIDENTTPAPGWARTTVNFESGDSEAVLATRTPKLAVIRTRFRWFVNFNGVTTFYPRTGYVENSGMRGHIQALCGVHGFDFPIVVTFKGTASRDFEKLLKDWAGKIMGAANKATGHAGNMPRFAFYLKLAPGPHIKAGKKGQESIVTPPVLELPAVISDEYLSKIYVGRDKLIELQQVYRDAAEWADAWGKPGAEVSQAPEGGQAPGEMDGDVNPYSGEIVTGAVDILDPDQVAGALKASGVKDSTLREALKQANGNYQYVPERDTPLVRKLVAEALAAF